MNITGTLHPPAGITWSGQLRAFGPILQREAVADADQLHLALVESGQCRTMADREDRRRRQFPCKKLVERGFRGLIERGGCLIEEKELRRVQQRTREAQALLLA